MRSPVLTILLTTTIFTESDVFLPPVKRLAEEFVFDKISRKDKDVEE